MFTSLLVTAWALLPLMEQPAASGRADALIARLGSKDFAEREAATRALEAMGACNLHRLQLALKSSDPEVRYRAEILTQAIERRELSARLLAPRKVRFDFHDSSLDSALGTVSDKIGLHLSKDPGVASAPIDLQTGEIPLWEALDQFCQKAGLIDVTQERLRRMQFARDAAEQAVNLARAFPGQVQPPGIRQAYSTRAADNPSRLILTGRPDYPIATSYAGAVRMRIMEPARRSGGEIRLSVDVSVEPGISWRQILDLRVDRAIDNRDRRLMQPLVGEAAGADPEVVARVFMNDMAAMGRYASGDEANLVIRLKDEKNAERLKDLSGTLVAQLVAPMQEYVRVDGVQKQTGKTFRSGRGESIEISSVEVQQGDRVRLRLAIREPNSSFLVSRNGRVIALNGQLGNRIVVQGNVVVAQGPGARSGTYPQSIDLRFFDKDDRQIYAESLSESIRIVDGEVFREFEFLVPPGKGQSPLDHLSWYGRRIETVDVPFRFSDIPLPPRSATPSGAGRPLPSRYPPGDFGNLPMK